VPGLPRFSEDIASSLLDNNDEFSISSYLSGLKTELQRFEFEAEMTKREKQTGPVESAFIKAPTRIHLLQVNPDPSIVEAILSNQLLKVKLRLTRIHP